MTFGEELRAWRQREGLTQREAAEFLKVNRRTYEDWEYGRFVPDHLELIRRAIKVATTSLKKA
jgi:transcriptional regulator with XRE-family HTH domain